MKTLNISILKSLINKDVQIVQLKKTQNNQVFTDGKSSAYSY